MDNLRPLSRSLPSHHPPQTSTIQAPESVLQSFKEAALSVTKLYKEAAATHQRARQAGYQDALDDLLSFLDREDLGLSDGEGWRVRQWATERLDTSDTRGEERDEREVESEDEGTASPVETQKRENSERTTRGHTAPVESTPQANTESATQAQTQTLHQQPASSTPPSPSALPTPNITNAPKPGNDLFTFRAPLPASISTQTPGQGTVMDTDAEEQPTFLRPHSVRKKHHVHSLSHGHNLHNHNRNVPARDKLGTGAGAKRKFAMGDFFDLSDLGVKEWNWNREREREREREGKKGRWE